MNAIEIVFKKLQIIESAKISGKILLSLYLDNNLYEINHKPLLRKNIAAFYQQKIQASLNHSSDQVTIQLVLLNTYEKKQHPWGSISFHIPTVRKNNLYKYRSQLEHCQSPSFLDYVIKFYPQDLDYISPPNSFISQDDLPSSFKSSLKQSRVDFQQFEQKRGFALPKPKSKFVKTFSAKGRFQEMKNETDEQQREKLIEQIRKKYKDIKITPQFNQIEQNNNNQIKEFCYEQNKNMNAECIKIETGQTYKQILIEQNQVNLNYQMSPPKQQEQVEYIQVKQSTKQDDLEYEVQYQKILKQFNSNQNNAQQIKQIAQIKPEDTVTLQPMIQKQIMVKNQTKNVFKYLLEDQQQQKADLNRKIMQKQVQMQMRSKQISRIASPICRQTTKQLSLLYIFPIFLISIVIALHFKITN